MLQVGVPTVPADDDHGSSTSRHRHAAALVRRLVKITNRLSMIASQGGSVNSSSKGSHAIRQEAVVDGPGGADLHGRGVEHAGDLAGEQDAPRGDMSVLYESAQGGGALGRGGRGDEGVVSGGRGPADDGGPHFGVLDVLSEVEARDARGGPDGVGDGLEGCGRRGGCGGVGNKGGFESQSEDFDELRSHDFGLRLCV